MPALRSIGGSAALLGALVCGLPTTAQAVDWSKLDFSGYVAGETRLFPESAQFDEQRDAHISPSLVIQPELR